jgi:hypothetical protein
MIDAYMWTTLAARQGSKKAIAILPFIQDALTPADLEKATAQTTAFRAKDNLMAQHSRNLYLKNALKRAARERRVKRKSKN